MLCRQKQAQDTLSRAVTDRDERLKAYDEQIRIQTNNISALREQLSREKEDAQRQIREIIAKYDEFAAFCIWLHPLTLSQRKESERQAAAYEKQRVALQQRVDEINKREQERVTAIRNQVWAERRATIMFRWKQRKLRWRPFRKPSGKRPQ